MAIKKVVVFRHGQTEWNRRGKMQGHVDNPLNPKGLEQAESLAAILASHPIEAILSSDLARAFQTGSKVAERLEIPIQSHSNLREIALGEAEGLTIPETDERYGKGTWRKWCDMHPDNDHFGYPGGETKGQVHKRVIDFLNSNLANRPEKMLGVSIHGFTLLRIMVEAGIEINETIKIPNCIPHLFEFDILGQNWKYIRELTHEE